MISVTHQILSQKFFGHYRLIASLSTQYIFSEMILQGDNTYADVVSWGEISPPVVVVFWGGWRLV